MVLADLGRKLNAALSSLNRAPIVDEKVRYHTATGDLIIIIPHRLGPRRNTQRNHRRAARNRR